MKSKRHTFLGLLSIAIMVVSGCENPEAQQQNAEMAAADAPQVQNAIAVLHPTEGSEVSGVVRFSRVGDGIRVVAEVEGLTPGERGFHVHEYGDCSAPDGTSAGGHFAPQDMPHGAPTDDQRHVGDLGNISVGEDGTAQLEWVDPLMTFSGPNSIIGRGVIVHEGQDDLTTQPTGDAGGRVACGVIGVAQ